MVTINKIEYRPTDMIPIIILDTGKCLTGTYNDGGESLRATTRHQLEKLIGNSYQSINTLKWYIVDKTHILKKLESKNIDSYNLNNIYNELYRLEDYKI